MDILKKNRIFICVLSITLILFILDLLNISNIFPWVKNLSIYYDWLGYFGTIVGVYVTIKVFEKTLEGDRVRRMEDSKENQFAISEERRLSNIPWLSIKVLSPSSDTLKSVKYSRFIYLLIENVGLNHAIITDKKEDDAPTEELSENIDNQERDNLTIVKKDCIEKVVLPISESNMTTLRIYYMDIYKNYYYDEFEIEPQKFSQTQYNREYYCGILKVKKIGIYDSHRDSRI